MIIKQPHWCPKCRVMLEEWQIPGSGLKQKKIKPGDPWPRLEPFHSETYDKCHYCGAEMKGQIHVEVDEHGEFDRFLAVQQKE